MNPITAPLRIAAFATAVLFATTTGVASRPTTAAQNTSPTAACTAPEYHQLDFWVGDSGRLRRRRTRQTRRAHARGSPPRWLRAERRLSTWERRGRPKLQHLRRHAKCLASELSHQSRQASRGTTYTKSDLVEDTSGRHQQAVRVWGDTAVITAELWEKVPTQASRSITPPGSAKPTCVLPPAGATFCAIVPAVAKELAAKQLAACGIGRASL
jgi:hypothetical protein